MSVNLQSTAIRQKPNNAIKNSDLIPIVNDLELLNSSSGGISSIVAGTGINVDNTDPENPIITNTNTSTYTKYVALITQTGTDAPTAIELENTIGTLTWSYVGVGDYTLNSASLFTNNKLFVILPPPNSGSDYDNFYNRLSASSIRFQTKIAGGIDSNDIFDKACLEIRVYA